MRTLQQFTRALALCVVASSVIELAAAPQEGNQASESWAPWRDELRALSPSDPLAYIELAEDMLDAAHTVDTRSGNELRQLAQQLFGRAGALDPSVYGRSACLALAELSSDKMERERFLALAKLLPSRDVLAAWSLGAHEQPVSPSVALALSEALGYYRQGLGNRALSTLQKHDTETVLERFGDLLPGGPDRFLEDCKHYVGGRKPTIFEDGIARMLILESALLAGTERTWAGEVLLTTAPPLIEIDPSRLDEMLGVDASRPYFVNGSWERVAE
jgi:hypothetical protein